MIIGELPDGLLVQSLHGPIDPDGVTIMLAGKQLLFSHRIPIVLRQCLVDMVVFPVTDVQKRDHAAGYDNPLDARRCGLADDIEGPLSSILMIH